MDLTPIVAAVRQRCPSFAQRVAGAAEYAAALASTSLQTPYAFVIPLDDNPGPRQSENVQRQSLADGFAVVVALSNAADERGQASAAVMHATRAELWAALLGWSPAAEYEGVVYDGGSLQALDRARLWYQFEFSAETEIGPEDGWQGLDELPGLESVHLDVDAIDPQADPNLQSPGPDGRIEQAIVINNLDN
jgi:hypothetical protein